MKLSKKIIILFLVMFILSIYYGYTKIISTKYPLSKIKPNKIESVELYNENNYLTYNADDKEGKKILKLIKKLTEEGTFTSHNKSYKYNDNFTKDIISKNPKNDFIKISFTSNEKLYLKNTIIFCTYIIVDVDNKVLYYWLQTSSSINELSIENTDLNNLNQFLKSNF